VAIEPCPVRRSACRSCLLEVEVRDRVGTKMQRGRTCRFLRHRRPIWHRDYVARPAPSARSGSGMYSQKMNNLNRISTRQVDRHQTQELTQTEQKRNPRLSLLRPLFSYRQIREFLPEFLDTRRCPSNLGCWNCSPPIFRQVSMGVFQLIVLWWFNGVVEGL